MTEEAKKPEESTIETQEQSAVKQEEAVKSVDETMDAILDKEEGKEKPSESSSDSKEKPAGEEPEKPADGTEDPDLAKKGTKAEKEPEIPKEFHDHEAWKRNAQIAKDAIARAEAAEAKTGELEKSGVLSEEDKALLEQMKNFTSSKQFLADKYKSEGFKDEVIKEKLAEAGFKDTAESAEDSLKVAADALGLDVNTLSDQDKSDITNLVKISNALVEKTLNKVLPEVLNPISEQVAGLTSKESGLKLHDEFAAKVKEDGVLDYEKDLAPDITKWLDDNDTKPEADRGNQQALAKFLQDTYHDKLVLHKKAVEKKDERVEKLNNNRPGGEGGSPASTAPAKTGEFETDANNILDSMGVH